MLGYSYISIISIIFLSHFCRCLSISSTRCPIYKTLKETVHFLKTTMVHPLTVPIPNFKLKIVSKCYHVLYNNSMGKNTISEFQNRIIHDKSKRAPILCSYEYVQLNQLQMSARSHHTILQNLMISHTKIFLRQPICQGVQFRSPCNVRHTNFVQTSLVIKHTATCQHAPHDIIRFYIILQLYIRRH